MMKLMLVMLAVVVVCAAENCWDTGTAYTGGSTISYYYYPTIKTAQKCYEKCMADEDCELFNWWDNEYYDFKRMCYLKRGKEGTTANTNPEVTSGGRNSKYCPPKGKFDKPKTINGVEADIDGSCKILEDEKACDAKARYNYEWRQDCSNTIHSNADPRGTYQRCKCYCANLNPGPG